MKRACMLTAATTIALLMGSSAFALDPSSFDVGAQFSRITYKEPGIMRESGEMYGVAAMYTRVENGLMWRVDGTLTTGEVDYDGSYSDGTPVTINGIRDTMFEVRAVMGPAEFVKTDSYYLPYIGLGYRYLSDELNKAPGGYLRESNYTYIPVGVDGMVMTSGRWSVGFTVEYDIFVSGTQCSRLSDIDPGYSDMENSQSSGSGYRASLKFMLDGKRDLIIEPFVKYWKIGESDTTLITYYGTPYAYGYEPSNNSTEVGVKVLLRF